MTDFPERSDGVLDFSKEIADARGRHMLDHQIGMGRLWGLLLSWRHEGVLNVDQIRQVSEAHDRDLAQQPDPEEVRDQRLQMLIYDWCHDGTLNSDQVKLVCEAYNGVPCTHAHGQCAVQ